MKSIITICVIIFALFSVLFIGITELRDVNRIQQSEINFLLHKNAELESQNNSLLKTCDSLLLKMDSIK